MSMAVGVFRQVELQPDTRNGPTIPEFDRGKAAGSATRDSCIWHATEELLIRAAEATASPRPLMPYPGWRFDIDWDNPDPVFQIRRQIWCWFRDRKIEAPVRMNWQYGLVLKLWLGNDLSKQLFIAGCNEPNEMTFVDRFLKPGMVFLDAGAHEGVYTLLASHRVEASGCVYACEPSPRESSRLDQNLSLNALSNVRAFPVALADENRQVELNIAEAEHSGQNTLGGFAYEIASAGKVCVTARRLDDLLADQGLRRLDLMKVDVEGAEFHLLRGARHVLSELRPVVLFEVSKPSLGNTNSGAGELLEFLRSFGYDLYVFDDQTGVPAAAKPGELSGNMVAAPIEAPVT